MIMDIIIFFMPSLVSSKRREEYYHQCGIKDEEATREKRYKRILGEEKYLDMKKKTNAESKILDKKMNDMKWQWE